jgi:hypothetical protein
MPREAAAIDAAEVERLGKARGDELPKGLRCPSERRQRLRAANRLLQAPHVDSARFPALHEVTHEPRGRRVRRTLACTLRLRGRLSGRVITRTSSEKSEWPA